MGFWGVSKREAWQQFCAETRAQYINRGFWSGDRVELKFQNWTIVLDTYTVSTGKSSVTYTRIRAPFVNRDGFRFRVYRKGIFSDIAKFFGAQDIEIGDSEFDELFIIKSSDERTAVKLLSNNRIKELFHVQPHIDIQIKDDDGFWGTSFPNGVDELYFNVTGVIKDIDRLKALFDLFGEMLITLVEVGVSEDTEPGISI